MTKYIVYEINTARHDRTGNFKVFRDRYEAKNHLALKQKQEKRENCDWLMEEVDHVTYSVPLTFEVYDERKQEYVEHEYYCEYTDADIEDYFKKTFKSVAELAEFVSDFDGDFQEEMEKDDGFLEYLMAENQKTAQDDYDEDHPMPLTKEDWDAIEGDRLAKLWREENE